MGRTLARTLVLVVANLLLLGVLVEVGIRAVFAVEGGWPVLFYGTSVYRSHRAQENARALEAAYSAGRDDPAVHAETTGAYRDYDPEARGYAKYRPHERKQLRSATTGRRITAHVNAHGFRGPEFVLEKPPGTVRVLALGASSTFGYGVADDETWPRQLEAALRSADGRRFEVLNLGIPHATSGNMLALLRAEGLALGPDVVVFYEGANDAVVDATVRSGLHAWLHDHLLAFAFGEHLWRTFRPPLEGWSEVHARERSAVFLANVAAMAALCREHGVRFLPVTQQTRSLVLPPEQLAGVSYAEEVAFVRDFLARPMADGRMAFDRWREASRRVRATRESPLASPVTSDPGTLQAIADFAALDKARVFLVHARLMDDLRAWAAANDVPLVDGIAALDDARPEIFSWVHLTPEGNRQLAAAVAQAIRAELQVAAPARPVESPRPAAPPTSRRSS